MKWYVIAEGIFKFFVFFLYRVANLYIHALGLLDLHDFFSDKQPFNEKCHDSSVCPTCFLYPFSKAGVICGIEGDKYRLLDGTLVPIIDVQHSKYVYNPCTEFLVSQMGPHWN